MTSSAIWHEIGDRVWVRRYGFVDQTIGVVGGTDGLLVPGQAPARVLGDDFRAAATARERECLVIAAYEPSEQFGGFDVGRSACARVRVEQWSLPAGQHALGSWRRVVVDLLHVEAAQRARELAGIADGRAGEKERR